MTKPRFVEDEEGFAHLWRDAQRRRGTHFGLWMRRPKAKEAFMRAIAAAIVAIAVLAVGGLTLRHTMESATAASPEQAKAQIDTNCPELNAPGSLLGGPRIHRSSTRTH
jgi:hypothetical protein